MNKVLLVLVLGLGLVNCQSTKEIKNVYPDSCLEQENNCGDVFDNYPEVRIDDIKKLTETISNWEFY